MVAGAHPVEQVHFGVVAQQNHRHFAVGFFFKQHQQFAGLLIAFVIRPADNDALEAVIAFGQTFDAGFERVDRHQLVTLLLNGLANHISQGGGFLDHEDAWLGLIVGHVFFPIDAICQ